MYQQVLRPTAVTQWNVNIVYLFMIILTTVSVVQSILAPNYSFIREWVFGGNMEDSYVAQFALFSRHSSGETDENEEIVPQSV